jgi:hypothetical protein
MAIEQTSRKYSRRELNSNRERQDEEVLDQESGTAKGIYQDAPRSMLVECEGNLKLV